MPDRGGVLGAHTSHKLARYVLVLALSAALSYQRSLFGIGP